MTKGEFLKKFKKDKPWDVLAVRSLSSSNLTGYGSIQYSSTPPLLTRNLSQARSVQRSLSSGTSPAFSLDRLLVSEYPHSADQYELLRICGTGATAKVWKARCLPLKQLVAVKQVELEISRENLETVIQEAQLLSSLRHPNILPMLACFVEGDKLNMVTPYVQGGSVESALQYGFTKGLEERVVAPIMLSVLHALAYLHKHSIVHRDVKASNILLNTETVILGDFGIATRLDRVLDTPPDSRGDFGRYLRRQSYVGTPVWMPPEIIEQLEGHGLKADIYAFGVTLIEMAMGRPPYAGMPFEGLMTSKLHHDPPELPAQHEGRNFSPDMRDVVAQCLRRDPDKRPTAAKLLKHRFFRFGRHPRDALEELLSGIPGPVKRLDSLVRRKEEAAKAEAPDFSYAADEHIPLHNIKSKEATQAMQQWGAKEAEVILRKMLDSTGINPIPVDKSFSAMSGSTSEAASPGSALGSSLNPVPRRLSFASRQKSFAKGEQWPNLPGAALNYCKGVMFATGVRRGFGVQSSYGHAFTITNICKEGGACFTGPCYLYLTASKSVGVGGDNTRESIVLFRDSVYNDMIVKPESFKLGDIKLIDAVEENLGEEDIIGILKEENSKWNGVAFRHYATSKGTWKAASSSVMVDDVANEKLYKKPTSPAKIFKGEVPPPISFQPLINTLLKAAQGRYERDLAQRSSDDSEHGFSRNGSRASFAKISTGSIGPSNSVDHACIPENDRSPDPEFLLPPPSSFSCNGGDSPDDVASQSGREEASPTASPLPLPPLPYESRPKWVASSHPGRRGLIRTNSEPALPQLEEVESWEVEMGTPPPYAGLAEDYYATLEEASTPPSPAPEALASTSYPTSGAERPKESTPKAVGKPKPRPAFSAPEGISPPTTEDSSIASLEDTLNPFLLAANCTEDAAAAPIGESSGSSPIKPAGSWRPPKPAKAKSKNHGNNAALGNKFLAPT